MKLDPATETHNLFLWQILKGLVRESIWGKKLYTFGLFSLDAYLTTNKLFKSNQKQEYCQSLLSIDVIIH